MAQKIHPKSYRLGITENWHSRWISKKQTPQLLEEDYKIRQFLMSQSKPLRIEKVEIERKGNELKIVIFTPRTGLLIGRQGQGIKALEKKIKEIVGEKKSINISVEEVSNPDSSSQVVAEAMAEEIEKRQPYRLVLNRYLKKIMQQKGVLGAKVMVSGRLDGAEIARDEWLKEGKLPLSTLRSDIDYGFSEAHCTYGVVGVKVWFYKGEKDTSEVKPSNK